MHGARWDAHQVTKQTSQLTWLLLPGCFLYVKLKSGKLSNFGATTETRAFS